MGLKAFHRFKWRYIDQPISAAPLAVFRIFFGAVMLVSILRFLWNDWVQQLYLKPAFHFSYFGFEWVQAFGPWGMYGLFALMALSAVLVTLGLYYRLSIITFFLTFTYVELIDKTYYLNHYYFISLVALILIALPAHRYFSLDVLRKPSLKMSKVPAWTVNILRFQLAIVYLSAGLAKLNPDWLFRAMPMHTWLSAHMHWPLVGPLLAKPWVAFIGSWFGALYDLSIVFIFMVKRLRWFGYALVVVFHGLTAILFQIGMFPYIMIGATLIFFSPAFHDRLIQKLTNSLRLSPYRVKERLTPSLSLLNSKYGQRGLKLFFVFFILFQVIWPWRFLAYPGNLFWNYEGYRFSWRVMLTEKAGTAFFQVKDPDNGNTVHVSTNDHLTGFQEKIMATQPGMILEFAHYLADLYEEKGIEDPVVTVNSFVALNGRSSKRFIDPNVNLADCKRGFHHKSWVIPFKLNKHSSPLNVMQ
jgi:hypothetical protein